MSASSRRLSVLIGGLCWLCFLAAIGRANGQPTPAALYLPLLAAIPSPAAGPSWGAPIAVAPRDGRVWVANPDAGSISAVDPARGRLIATLATGGEPWSLAFTPGGALLALDRAGGELLVIDPDRRAVGSRLTVGREPGQVAVSADGRFAYVSLSADSALAIVDLDARAVTRRVALPPHPYAVAVGADGRVYVTHFLAQPLPQGGPGQDDGAAGLVSVLDRLGERLGTIVLPPDQHGVANQLASISLYGGRAWVTSVRAAPAQPNRLSSTVFAAVSSLDLGALRDDTAARLNLNDETTFGSPVNNPVAAVPAPDGRRLYIVLAGSDLIEVVDVAEPARPRLLGFLPAGRNPRGIALSADGRHGYVMSYLSRAVTVLDLERMAHVAEIRVADETLDTAVLRGKILFNTVADPRMAKSSWVSCASCHADGGADGLTWAMADGPRQTPPLWNAGATLPWHWSAALDEPHDVEDSIAALQFGLGLAPGADPPLLGAPNARRSADLDALAAFLEHGIRPPRAPTPSGDLSRGRALFAAAGCAGCHGGPHWTISALPGQPGTLDPDGDGVVNAALRDVGSANPADVRGAEGFDVPSLIGVGLTAPYLHDGSQPTLAALLDSGHPAPGQPRARPLAPDERAALIAFIQSIDATTSPIPFP